MILGFIITQEKVLTAFIGATAALLLKHFYDEFKERIRLREIRKMIYLDLVQQRSVAESKLEHCQYLKGKLESGDDNEFELKQWDLFSLTVFKSHQIRDYYKTFTNSLYLKMSQIYLVIEQHKTTHFKDAITAYINDGKNASDKRFLIHNLTTYSQSLEYTIRNIRIFLEEYRDEYF
ncbi:hypothetical protein [Pontibacter virosus]|uniref:Uncharacterized protein n=1 Tax=Pontibacter virosus TaxID=1765052 RepID=A0A2U1B2T1_9BACT|nr:hypothetical protein [Pontibacter virosus]PVY42837.1 hypothetical protein C8E01_10210 [Pontibacter virosus]